MSSYTIPSSFGLKPVYSQLSTLGQLTVPQEEPFGPKQTPSFNAIHVVTSTVTNAGTMTSTDVKNGVNVVFHDGTSGALYTPTAAAIVKAMQGCTVGTAMNLHVINTGSGTSTLTAGTGVTISGTAATTTLNVKTWQLVVTSNVIGAESVTFYSLGSNAY